MNIWSNGIEEKVFLLDKIPTKIISIVPSQTELLYDLGLEDSIVGITKFCVHPLHLKATKKIVGGTKNVNFEKVQAQAPDIIIANKEENTKEMVAELSFICPVIVTDIKTVEDNLQMILDFGTLFNKRIEAQKWHDKIHHAFTNFKQYINKKYSEKPKKKVAYFIWKNPFMVAGKDTFINTLLQLNHFENIYAVKGRYPEIELKKMRLEGDPDVVFLSSEPYPFKEEDAFEIGRFAHHAKTVFIDGEMFSWYGSRLLRSFDYFKALHNKI